MNNEELKKLAIDLAVSESAEEVKLILDKFNLYNKPEAWRNFGDRENNFSTIGNQQESPEVALVEKLVNSIDSVLTAECYKNNINPESEDAPSNIYEAAEKFYNIPNGKLSNITASERRKIAEENIGLMCSGKLPQDGNPNYTIFDFGEGQIPSNIHKTFMSIGLNNKNKIPFVQGKFNMGGTGVFRFSNSKISQFLITKRNPILLSEDDPEDKDKWGFTVVKKIPPTGNMKSSKYVYLVNPETNNPFSFNSDYIKILPGSYPSTSDKEMRFGSFIKLYEYQMGNKYRSAVTLDLFNRLSLLMPSVAIPIRLYERRLGYNARTYETTLNGISVRLEEDKSKNLESEDWPTSEKMTINGEEFQIKIYAFKKTAEGSKRKNPTQNYVDNEGIIFTINGQTHGSFNRSFFNKKNIGLGIISKYIIVNVDASNISGEMRETIFMNSRDRLQKSGEIVKKIENNLERILSTHQGLKNLKNKRYEEEVRDKLDDSKPLQEIVEKIMNSSPSLSKIFLEGSNLKNPLNLHKGGSDENYIGKRFPSFFTITKKYKKTNPRKFPANQNSIRIEFKTDVVNDYFDREIDKGEHRLYLNDEIFEGDSSIGLWNGTATLSVYFDESLNKTEILKFRSEISDVSKIESIYNEFYVEVSEEKISGGGNKGQRKPSVKEGNGDQDISSGLSLPVITEVERDDENWNEHGFNDHTSLLSVYNGKELGYSFYLNMSNIFLLNHIKENQEKIDSKIVKAQYKYANALIALSVIQLIKQGKVELKDDEKEEELIKQATTCASMILIPMISYLGKLE